MSCQIKLPAVLGIDAAWTNRHDSGIALIEKSGTRWRCVALAPSIPSFIRLTEPVELPKSIQVQQFLEVARQRVPANEIQVIAVDMPLSTKPITARRVADDLVSKHFGAFGCGTHSPTSDRPGSISSDMRGGFESQGYTLRTLGCTAVSARALIEVFPHPALLALCNCDYRLPYKVHKARKYWPNASSQTRRRKLIEQSRQILQALKRDITEIPLDLDNVSDTISAADLKAIEDMIDALVCAWVGIKFLRGEADPYGDESAAIWVPRRASATIA